MADENIPAPASFPTCLSTPQISLVGEVNESLVRSFLDQLDEAEKSEGDIAVELTTPGGDAELARRLVLEVRNARARMRRRLIFYGKTEVYSAGVTLMAAFPKEDRYLSSDAILLIHCRQLDKTVEISGPIRASLPKLDAVRHQIEIGIELEDDNFKRLIEGSGIGFEELTEKALHNWYLPAQDAFERGLVAGILSCSKDEESRGRSTDASPKSAPALALSD